MSTASVTETVAAPAAEVWRVMSNFAGVEPNEMIAGCSTEGEGVGAVRTITLTAGGEIVERLESLDAATMSFSYAIINDSPLPVADYLSTVRIRDDGKGGASVTWSSTFTARGAPEADVVKLVEGVYKGGIARARAKLGL
ncbi:MAG: SRPBCC family protein [Gammaproteobacteria bacterium]